ncbi:hypothetical protein K2173_004864 [Erythroxylum novogranatense]|uniref:Lethal giant larvae (Lgl)-like C-terminal domain-containing protein n=1 Tax=Erythroxylum novogranatense TaxID=1862640 RepID=A0AAV8TBH7_9ROSI|nr:hypothetical protein K2173_004864 [Erythroxylum novogranatense]
MFVKKLVEKASKKTTGNWDGIKSSDVDPRLAFHYGIPSGAAMLAYDPIQKILAISTKDGRIKLFGKDNTQTLLESPEAVPSKFLQFFHNRGYLLNVTSNNHIEVWDVDKKLLSQVHALKEDITSFSVMQLSLYMYVGDSLGNVSVFRLIEEPCQIVPMAYNVPLSASHGNSTEVSSDTTVVDILPQPTAESKRMLIVFRNGVLTLWDLRESKSIFTTVGSLLQSQNNETKKVTYACWVCPIGSKVAVGYSNGEILIWGVPDNSTLKSGSTSDGSFQSIPTTKLNLGYKVDKVPIASMKWLHAEGKASRLYVMGASDFSSSNMLQVILLNEQTETRTIKLGLHLSEPSIDMEIICGTCEQNKHKQDSLILLGKSGHIYAYDDHFIEKYLLQSQTRNLPSLPKEIKVKMPFAESSITVAKFITGSPNFLISSDEDYNQLAKNFPSFLPLEAKPKDGTLIKFTGFTKVKNLYITGHSDGSVNFWDATSPFFTPVLLLKQQSEDDFSVSGVELTALYFDVDSRFLISGDQSGTVRIYKFKPEPYATDSIFMPFQGISKKGNNHIIQSVKLIKLNGPVLYISTSRISGRLVVGSDQGYVSLIDIEGPTLLYQKHIASEISTGIISVQSATCSIRGFEKNTILVATKDSSIFALEDETGNMLSTNIVQPKKPSRALFLQIFEGQDSSGGSHTLNVLDPNKSDDVPKQSFVLICSEKAVYVYSLNHVVQGIKKVHYKKKFHSSSCCWASTFYSDSKIGLILCFSNERIEIRSLPELSLINEYSIRGFTHSVPKVNSMADSSICCSRDGELIVVNSDQEIFVVSFLLQKEHFRLLNSVSQVYQKDLLKSRGLPTGSVAQKEKKKGMFSSVIRDIKGGKSRQVLEMETEDTKESIEELAVIFSTENFARNDENKDTIVADNDETELDIDDIDLEDSVEKPKDQNILLGLNQQKLAKKLQAFGGKIKQMKVKTQKNANKEEENNEKFGSVDQIKKKYGFSSTGDSSAAEQAQIKLQDNVTKLQGINVRATEMQDTARSFSSMAKEVLRIAEKDKRAP